MSVTQSPQTHATKTKKKSRKEKRARATWLARWKKAYSKYRAAKIGTKAFTARRVFYQQNKERVKKRAAELHGTNTPSIGASATALTQLYKDLPQE